MSDWRAKWDNSQELRTDVERRLLNWAEWSRGGRPDLGYDRKANFATLPSKCGPPVDVEAAEQVEDVFVLWRLVVDAEQDREYLLWLQRLLRLHFLSGKAVDTKRKIAGVSRRAYYAALDDGMYRFWLLDSV